MRRIDELYLRRPYFGSRRLADELSVNRKRMQRLMRIMGLEAIYPKPRTTVRHSEHKSYPYLLRNVEVVRPNQVWSTDIYVHPVARRIPVPDGRYGLVQPVRAELAIVEQLGRRVLPCGLGGGVARRSARDFQHRPRGRSSRA